MAKFSIPVNLFNPGQVFACLGFLEAAEVLCGDAEGGFDWSDETEVKFHLRADCVKNPFQVVLDFLAGAEAAAVAPKGWRPKKEPTTAKSKENLEKELRLQKQSDVFPSRSPDTSSAMPVQISINNGKQIVLGHWADGSSRNSFKLYAGNRSALKIATVMTEGIKQLWNKRQNDLIEKPFDVTAPMAGSFNFDPRGAWTAIDAGYSPNDQKHQVTASPLVELLTACGLENARPDEFETRKVSYTAWGVDLPPMLARVALFGGIDMLPMRRFRFELDLSGKNKIVTFAELESTND